MGGQAQAKLGMIGIIFGVLLLVVGLVFSDLIIDNVNRQGAKIGCYDGNDIPIMNTFTWNLTGTAASVRTPKKVSKTYQGADNIGQLCGNGTVATASAITGATVTGTVRYALEVYGADSLNNLFTLVYFIVLVGISLSMVGGGGYAAYRGARGM